MESERSREILELFPFFQQASDAFRREVETGATLARLAAGEFAFHDGQACDKIVFLGRGSVRVFKIGKTGREITLYHVRRGEACILNVSCLVADVPYPADAVAEQAVEAVALPPGPFLDWVEKQPTIRRFVLQMLSTRLVSMLCRVEELVLTRRDRRLAEFLLSRFRSDGPTLALTHDAIAAEVGSAREVMSRLLKDLERGGVVRLGRGQIELLDEVALDRAVRESDERLARRS